MTMRRDSMNRVARRAVLIALLLGSMGSAGGSCCGGGGSTPVGPPKADEVWCDFSAVKCLMATRDPSTLQPNGCVAVPCTTASGAACNNVDSNFVPEGTGPNDFSTCDPSTCTVTPIATAESGTAYPQCFDHNTVTAAQACQNLCNPTPDAHRGKDSLDPIDEPPQPNLRSVCVGTVDPTNTAPGGSIVHPAYDSASVPGGPLDYLANGCNDPGQLLGDPAGTNRVALAGAGTFTSPGNDVSATTVAMNGGFFNIDAVNTTCNALQTTCSAAINQIEIDFADFTAQVAGSGHPAHQVHLKLDQSFLTPSGTFFPAGGGLPPSFSFELPPGIVFDSIGTVDGTLDGLVATSDQPTNGTINLATGQVTFDYDLEETVQGNVVELTGSATTAEVIDVAPVVTAPASHSVDVTTTCSANVTLAPAASSAVNLPVSFIYAVDGAFAGSGTTKTVSLSVGTHTALMVGTDTRGGTGTATETVTVNDETAPVFSNPPAVQTAHVCTNGSSAIPVTAPTAHDQCTGAPASVTGTIIQFNGAPVAIPVVSGSVGLPPGVGILRWVAQNANGVTTTFDQTLTVVGPPTFYGSNGVAIADRAIVNGSVLSGAGGVATVGNDSEINGPLLSLSPVQLRDRTTVTFIDTTSLTEGNNDDVGGVSNAALTLPAFPSVNQPFTGSTVVTVAVNGKQTLAPGQYGKLTVFSGGKLTLSAGVYAFTSFDLEPQATIVVPSATAETAEVYVRDGIVYRGSTTTASGALAPLFLAYTGTAAATIESAYTGTIIAPNASLTLQSLNGAGVYSGEFFAHQVSLSPATTTNSNPFTCH